MQAFSQKSYYVTQKMPNESLHWRENEDLDERTRILTREREDEFFFDERTRRRIYLTREREDEFFWRENEKTSFFDERTRKRVFFDERTRRRDYDFPSQTRSVSEHRKERLLGHQGASSCRPRSVILVTTETLLALCRDARWWKCVEVVQKIVCLIVFSQKFVNFAPL